MMRIPYGKKRKNVFDNIVPAEGELWVKNGNVSWIIPTHKPSNLKEWIQLVKSLYTLF